MEYETAERFLTTLKKEFGGGEEILWLAYHNSEID